MATEQKIELIEAINGAHEELRKTDDMDPNKRLSMMEDLRKKNGKLIESAMKDLRVK